MKKLFVIIGLSILLSVSAGYLSSKKTYTYVQPGAQAREMPVAFYNDISEKGQQKYFIIEDKFNMEKSMIVLAYSIGLGLTGLGFIKK